MTYDAIEIQCSVSVWYKKSYAGDVNMHTYRRKMSNQMNEILMRIRHANGPYGWL